MSEIKLRNRVTGETGVALEGPTLYGLFQLEGESDLLLNGESVFSGFRLVPDTCYRWTVNGNEGIFLPHQLPADITAVGVTEIGRRHAQLLEEDGTWTDWVCVSPLIPDIDRRIRIEPLEEELQRCLPHLEEVFRRPRTRLNLEVERTWVSRARRVPPDATEYLASHTEDWEYRTLRSVRPRRVLASYAEEDFDLYENRVAARLVDQMVAYLSRRIELLEKLRRLYQQVIDFSLQVRGTHWLERRLYGLWSDSIDANEGLNRTTRLRDELDQLRRRLQALQDTPVYRSLPTRTELGTSLRMTNILVNDQHYRFVARLWLERIRQSVERPRAAREVLDAHQTLCRSFEAFCVLLICRALRELGIDAEFDELPRPGSMIRAVGAAKGLEPFSAVRIHWQHDGVVILELESSRKAHFLEPLRIVTLPSTLAAPRSATSGPDLDVLDAQLKHLVGAKLSREPEPRPTWGKPAPIKVETRPVPPVILYLGTPDERVRLPLELARRLNHLGSEPLEHEREEPRLLPVSPLALESLERVTRLVRWWLERQRFLAWPPSEQEPMEAWRYCPQCSRQAPESALQARDANTFVCLCVGCKTAWGTRLCKFCREKYPFIETVARSGATTRDVDWIDRTFGRDVLASPCWRNEAAEDFVCPSCGRCPGWTPGIRCGRCELKGHNVRIPQTAP